MNWSHNTKRACFNFSQSLASWAGQTALHIDAYKDALCVADNYADIETTPAYDVILGLGEVNPSYLADEKNSQLYKTVHEMVATDISNTLVSMDSESNG